MNKKLSTESVVYIKIVLKCYIIFSPFSISLPNDPSSCDILQHVTQGKENPPHSFQLAGCFRHWVLVQDLLLHTQTHIEAQCYLESVSRKLYTGRKGNLWLADRRMTHKNVKYLSLDPNVSSELWTAKKNE